jgi:hypothetical protein
MSQTQLFNLNKIFILIFYPLFITFFINCSTGEPYRLGELVPSFQKYEETKIDPQMNEETAILKVEIGMQKYDDFFLSAKTFLPNRGESLMSRSRRKSGFQKQSTDLLKKYGSNCTKNSNPPEGIRLSHSRRLGL